MTAPANKPKVTIYRGKYPRRIESIWSVKEVKARGEGYHNVMRCRLNNGAIYQIFAVNGFGPKLGTEIDAHVKADGEPAFVYLDQSDYRRLPGMV